MQKELVISEELARTIANYLATRPWAEVNAMIAGLLNLKTAGGEPAPNKEEGNGARS